MPHRSRPVDSGKQLDRLEERHSTLKHRVHELERQVTRSPREDAEWVELKKMKLATKDALEALRRQKSA